jgi:hypothetical protein
MALFSHTAFMSLGFGMRIDPPALEETFDVVESCISDLRAWCEKRVGLQGRFSERSSMRLLTFLA